MEGGVAEEDGGLEIVDSDGRGVEENVTEG